jgi:hypothetical protein
VLRLAARAMVPAVAEGAGLTVIIALAAMHMPKKLPADWLGWVPILAVGYFLLRWLLKLLGIGR